METTITAYLVGALVTASLLTAWFYSTAPIHVLHIFRRLGWKKRDDKFWKQAGDEWESTWLDFEGLMANPSIPGWIATLVQCRYCLSFHIAFWVSIPIFFLANLDWTFIPAATFSWPVLAIIIMNIATRK